MVIVDTIINAVNTVIDKLIPDANVREQVKMAITTQALEWYKLESQDRDSARKREMEVKDTTPRYGFYLLSAGFYGVLGYMLMYELPPGSERVIDIMLGSLGTAWTAAVYYFYGTSHGSSEKSGIIDRIINHK